MVTLDARYIDEALLERARCGAAGWSTAEVLRAEAERLLAEESGCPQGRLREQARFHKSPPACGSAPAREGNHPGTASSVEQAEKLLQDALAIARSQGALAWELRSATSLAQLWQRQSRHREALDLLTPIYQRFSEGYASPDLRKVRLLLDALRGELHT